MDYQDESLVYNAYPGKASVQFATMQRLIPRGAAVGVNCSRCGVYFVTEDEGVYVCRWCQKTISGEDKSSAYESEDNLVL